MNFLNAAAGTIQWNGRKALLLLSALNILLLSAGESRGAPTREAIPAVTHEQIRALQAEKEARSPLERKLDSQLLYGLREKRQPKAMGAIPSLKAALRTQPDGRVLVDVRTVITPGLLARVERGGGSVVSSLPRYQALRAWVSLELAEELAAWPEVRSVRPAAEAFTNVGSVDSQGDIAHRADEVRNRYLVTGAGIKIGVLSDSIDYLATSQASGDLPKVTILPGQAGRGYGEGTAILEVIHDLVPEAELYFATAFSGDYSFAQNVRDLQAAGCQIIVDDVTYVNESPFQDSPISQAVNDVSAAGALYFSSAGNSGNKNDNTSGTWEGDFADGGPAAVGRGGRLHDFGGSVFNTVLSSTYQRVDLFWADPLGGSTNDYDVYVLNPDGTVARASTNVQDGDDDPYEAIGFVGQGQRIVIVKYSGESRFLHLATLRGRLAYATSGATYGHNASGASNAFSVAATWVRSPVAPFEGGAANPVEFFSSDGPRRMFFQPDGTPYTPGNFSASGGVALAKPDVTAADGVNTSVLGFETFFGTSAAAPHAAAVAALLWSYNPSLSPAQIRALLSATALDIEAPGLDQDAGAGIVMALPALEATPPPPPRLFLHQVTLVDANGNGGIDVSECAELDLTLRNAITAGGQAATGVTAVLTTITPGVLVDPAPRGFFDVPADGFGVGLAPFRISTTPDFICGTPIDFQLHVSALNAPARELAFQMAASPAGIGDSTVYQATSVPVPIPDLGTVESTVTVSNFNGILGRVTVELHLAHPYDSDLHVDLLGPDGTAVTLSANRGGSGDDFGASCSELTVFADAASNSVITGTAPFVGLYQPEQPLAAFSGLSDALVNGVWTLRLRDEAEQDGGTLQCWSLKLAPFMCTNGPGSCLLPPVIASQPQSLTATNGDTVQFAVGATGTGPLGYQWYFNGSAIAQATHSLLEIANVTPGEAGRYSVVVTNVFGSATSAVAFLTVVVPPLIVQEPADMTVTNLNRNAEFTVVALGTLPLSYQWFFNGTNALPDATNSSLSLPASAPEQAGSYHVMVANPFGHVVSRAATLELVFSPFITLPPQDQTVTNRQTATFSVIAGGTEPLRYQWYRAETEPIAGADGPTLVLTNVAVEQSGAYSVVISNRYGYVVSAEAELLVVVANEPPVVRLAAPTNDEVISTSGGPLPILAEATDADGQIEQVRFYADGVLLSERSQPPYQFEWVEALPGPHDLLATARDDQGATATSAVVRILVTATNNVTRLVAADAVWSYLDTGVDQGTNWQQIAFDDSTWASGPAQLGYGDGDEATVISYGPASTNKFMTAYFRRTFVLAEPQAYTNLWVRLLRDDGAVVYLNETEVFRSNMPTGWIAFNTRAIGAVGGTAESAYFTNRVESGLLHAGTNVVAVEVHQINATSTDLSFNLELLGQRDYAPRITVPPQSVATMEDMSATFTVTAAGAQPFSYQWLFERTNALAGATNAVLLLGNLTTNQAGEYSVVVSNPYGSATSAVAVLTVVETNLPPTIAWVSPTNGARYACGVGSILVAAVAGDEDGGIERVEFYADGRWLFTATNSPHAFEWLDAATGDHALWAVAFDHEGASATTAVVNVTVDYSTNWTRLIAANAVWKYLDTGTNLGVAWRAPEFEDAAWPAGPAQLGYGEGDEVTVIGYGPSATNKYVTTYFRRAFVVTEASVFTNLSFRLVRDDGAVVYLNGVEVFRSNMPTGTVAFGTFASAAVSGASENAFFPYSTGAGLLRNGLNVVAVEIHQINLTSSDLGFDLELQAARGVPPIILAQPQSRTVTSNSPVSFAVEAGGTPPLSYQWYFNGTNALAEGTNALYAIAGAGAAAAGNYVVVIANAYGSVTSAVAELRISSSNSPPFIALIEPLDGALLNGNSVIRLVTDAADPDGIVAQIAIYADGALLAEDRSAAFQFEWVDGRPGPHVLYATATDGLGLVATSAVINVSVNFTSQWSQLIATGAVWKYLDTGADQGSAWRELAFDDTAWAQGPAELGYGDAAEGRPEATIISYGPNPNNRFPTTYFRRAFVLTDAAAFDGLRLRVLRDDGAVVYLNGAEVFRSNMPTGTVGYTTWASSAIGGSGETNFVEAGLNVAGLQPGTNLLAVEVHQSSATSTDLSFDLELLGARDFTPIILTQPQDLVVTNGETAVLEVTAAGATPLSYQWFFNQSQALAGATNRALVLPEVTTNQAGLYSVRITNAFGSVTSGLAELTVFTPSVYMAPQVVLISPAAGAQVDLLSPVLVQAEASDPGGAIALVTFLVDGESLGSVTHPPFEILWTPLTLGSHFVGAVANDNTGLSTTSSVAAVLAVVPAPVTESLVATGAVWKYLDTGLDLGTAWRAVAFDDSAWQSGPAELGYGETSEGRPEATLVSFGPVSTNKYITTYFRHSFVTTNASAFTNLNVRLLRDDGAVVCLNGVEVFRSNLPTNAINFLTTAPLAISGSDETTYLNSPIDPEGLVNGTNVLAVEVHQQSPASTDLSFDLALEGTRLFAPWIVTPPVSQSVSNGETAIFTVSVRGAEPLAYQWFFNYTNRLAGATNRILVLAPVTASQAGIYRVMAWNDFGSVTSAPAQLTVLMGPENQPPLVALNAPVNGQQFDVGTSIAWSASASDADGQVVKVDFYADGIWLGQDVSSPYELSWPDAAVGVHELIAVAIDNLGARGTSSVVRVVVNLSSQMATILIPTGAVWKYLDNGVDQGTAWRASGFDDRAWASGPAELGFGDASDGRPEATVINSGPNPRRTYISYYFRHAFTVTNVLNYERTQVRLLRDDGAVVYLNGVEIFRSNMPTNQVTYSTRASSSVGSLEETEYFVKDVNPGLLQEGTNVVAVEVHQVNQSSTDLSFDLELLGYQLVPPLIYTPPASLTVTNGASALFEVIAGGGSPLQYQWYFNLTNILRGATNAGLQLTQVSTNEAGDYQVVVSNAAGSVTSAPALLTVLEIQPDFPPTVTLTSPTNGAVFSFDAVITLAATAEDFDGQIVRVEFYDGNGKLGEAMSVPYVYDWIGASLGTHTLRAVAVDDHGGKTASTSVAISVVAPPPSSLPIDLVSPGAVWRYLDTGVDQGTAWIALGFDDETWSHGPAELGYGDDVEGRPEATLIRFGPDANQKYPTYYFRHVFVATNTGLLSALQMRILVDDGAVVYLNGTEVFRTNLPAGPIAYTNYALVAVGKTEETVYHEIPLNPGVLSSGTNVVAVEVHQVSATSTDVSFDLALQAIRPYAPAITRQPDATTVAKSQTASFVVEATGQPPLAYQWFLNRFVPLPDATNAMLIITNAQPFNEGSYSVKVWNGVGSDHSDEAVLQVVYAPEIVQQPASLMVAVGGTAQFTVQGAGSPAPSYQWYFNHSEALAEATSPSLVISNVQAANAGDYTVVLSNRLGMVTSGVATLSLADLPVILSQPQNVTLYRGDTAQFAVLASSSVPPTYQWFYNETNRMADATNSALVLTQVEMSQSGDYHVAVSNPAGTALSQAAVLRVLEPANVTDFTREGSVVSLTFTTATGLRYTVEYKDDLNLPGWTLLPGAVKLFGTGSTLTVMDSAAVGSQRFYRIRVE